jgi:hypothetical protein
MPVLRFEDQQLTSFSGMVLFQALFQKLELREQLRYALARAERATAYGMHVVFLFLVVHILAGFRRLRERDYYRDDPILRRVLGVRRMPDTSTVTRRMSEANATTVQRARCVLRQGVVRRLAVEKLARVTLDFDGSVLSTRRHAEGAAIGFNRQRAGARSYYPLFCTVAQTGQFLDVHHRPGNVHDSNGACDFMKDCIEVVRAELPRAKLETRIDAAFFDEKLLDALDDKGVEFSVSVPFERFPALKATIEKAPASSWIAIDERWAYMEVAWRPRRWKASYRMIALRQRVPEQRKGPLQLDLFVPRDYEYDYRVIATNKGTSADAVRLFHHGRGSQEGLIGEAKDHAQLDYVPTRRLAANQLFLAASLMAHNLSKEIQMSAKQKARATSPTRPALWEFEKLGTLRHRLLQRAGRLTNSHGTLNLTLNANDAVQKDYEQYLGALLAA